AESAVLSSQVRPRTRVAPVFDPRKNLAHHSVTCIAEPAISWSRCSDGPRLTLLGRQAPHVRGTGPNGSICRPPGAGSPGTRAAPTSRKLLVGCGLLSPL